MPKKDKMSNNSYTIVLSFEANIEYPLKDSKLILEPLNSG